MDWSFLGIMVQFLADARHVSRVDNVRNCARVHPTLYPMSTNGEAAGTPASSAENDDCCYSATPICADGVQRDIFALQYQHVWECREV